MGKRWLWGLAIVFVAAVIFTTSITVITMRQWAQFVSSVFPSVTEEGFLVWWESWWWVFVKGYHVLEFLTLTLVAGWVLRKLGVSRWILWAAVTAMFYACTDEYHQTFVPARGGRVTDVLIDGIGVSLAVSILVIRSRQSALSVNDLKLADEGEVV